MRTPPGWALLAFPMLGSLLAWMFRPSERDLHTREPHHPPHIPRRILALPDGQALRFLGIPDPAGGTAFHLMETEIPASVWRGFRPDPPTRRDAEAFARHLSERTGRSLRLPTAAEWRLAARGGVPNANFPWGFGPHPPAGVLFGLEAPPRKTGPPLGYGFRDLAGGRWEWTQEGVLLGGAWSERDPDTLRIDHAWRPPPGYADRDTGFRLVWEHATP